MKSRKFISSKIIIPAFSQIFLISISRFIIGPVIPIISSELEISLSMLGWIISLNVFMLLISTLIAGNLIELFGFKKILYIAMFIQTIGFLIFYYINNLSLFIIGNSILGIGSGLAFVCLVVIANANPGRKTKGFFNLFLGAALALALAPALTIFIDSFSINWRYVFILFGIIQVLLIISFSFFKFPKVKKSVPNIENLISANRTFFRSPLLIIYFFFNVFNASVIETFYTWFNSYFSIYNVGISISSLLLFIFSAAVFIGIFSKKYLVKLTGEGRMLAYNVAFSILFLVLNLFIDNFILKSIIIFLFGFSLSANGILIISLALKDMREKYSSASGYLQGAEFLGIIIFQSVSGFILENTIKSGLIYMNIILLLILLFLAVIINYRLTKKRTKTEPQI